MAIKLGDLQAQRAFVLRAPFFAADFVFVFRFFAMLPS